MRTTHNEMFSKYLKEPHKTIYEIGSANGLRISDIVRLKKDCLTIEKPTIKEHKTGKSKRIYIPVKTREKMKEFSSDSKNEYIFYSNNKDGHISRQAVWKAFKTAAKKANISENVGTHTMRKNYATRYYGKCKSLPQLQKKLNHSKMADSILYLI